MGFCLLRAPAMALLKAPLMALHLSPVCEGRLGPSSVALPRCSRFPRSLPNAVPAQVEHLHSRRLQRADLVLVFWLRVHAHSSIMQKETKERSGADSRLRACSADRSSEADSLLALPVDGLPDCPYTGLESPLLLPPAGTKPHSSTECPTQFEDPADVAGSSESPVDATSLSADGIQVLGLLLAAGVLFQLLTLLWCIERAGALLVPGAGDVSSGVPDVRANRDEAE